MSVKYGGPGKFGGEEQKKEAEKKTYLLAAEFIDRFRERQGSVECRELIGSDLSTPEGMQYARDNNLFEERCTGFVQHSAEILEDLLSAP
ncbi:MAG: C-GCAxxG-C-C family protein [Gemmatimonadota bacterium]|nr:C-GCAxxG-C-C family protein [Gemmatimonadota bacterium]